MTARAMEVRRIAARVGIDAALWYCIPTFFLLIYVWGYSQPTSALVPHFYVVALPLGALFLARLVIARVAGSSTLTRVASTALTSTLLSMIVTYYALVLIGLESWGGVVTWNVIPVFFQQAPEVADALSIPSVLLACAPLLVYAGIVAASWSWSAPKFDWAPPLAGAISSWTLATLIVAGSAIVTVGIYQFSLNPWARLGEPLSLTLFRSGRGQDLEGVSVNPLRATDLDRREEAARKAYSPAPGAHRNLIVIVVDALRPDHMGIYGYSRDTTPHLARIASEHPTQIVHGVHASCGATACGMTSLFSSKFPQDFSFHPITLQESLRRNGYRVHQVLSGDQTYFYSLREFYGKVDSFYDGNLAHGYSVNDDRLVTDHLATLPDWDGSPTMFQFHLMSAHILRAGDGLSGKFQPAARYVFHDSRDTGAVDHVVPSATNFYDNGVLDADGIVATLLQTLQHKGYLSDALVVLTADHGEALGEHGLFHHANSVHEELLRIPLLLISYGYQPSFPAKLPALPSQVDIAPTILTELGLPRPRTWEGSALQEPREPGLSYFEQYSYIGLIDRRDPRHEWKYWLDRHSDQDRAFDLATDPHESRDVYATVPAELRKDWRTRVLSPAPVAENSLSGAR
jgi:glucan phosphoethanolaminetransferase (alkaline phosphatase superfamily)